MLGVDPEKGARRMIWIALLAMVFTIAVAAASLRSSRGDALGIPLVALGTFSFLYVIQPLQLLRTGAMGLFLTDWQTAKAIFVPAIMLAFFMWGWLHPGRMKPRESADWDPRTIWNFGFGAACIGAALYAVFLERSGGIVQSFSQAHGGAMAYNENTAYIYDGPWLMLSGSVMMLLGAQDPRRTVWRVFAPYAFFALFLLSAILTGGRGPLFAVVTTFFVGTSIALRRQVTIWQAGRMLLIAGLGVFLMLEYRNVLHLGQQTPQNTPSVDAAFNNIAGASEYDMEHDTASQEFLFHAAVLDTVDQTGKLEYGVSWLVFFVINPIPRVLWPEKLNPQWTGINWEDIKENTSIGIAPGAATGIVADLYSRFHLFSAVFFLVLGVGLRRLFIRARNLSSPVTVVGYVMMYAVSLNMFAQGFGAIFVPFGYSMAPVILLAWAARRSRRRAVLRQREILLLQAAAMRGKPCSS
jgi:hypothetical protein